MEGTMRFTYHIMPEFAKLSWCAKVNRGAEVTDVYAGAAVECQDTWFVSGVWDGDFRKADFDAAEFFCGTGAKIQGGEVVFYSYSHERQRLCCLEQAECFVVSNSIPMLLAVSGNAFDVNCDQYEKILCAILDGLKDYDRNIPLAGGVVMQQIFCADIHVNRELQINVVPKPRHRDFTDYQDYHDSLVAVCKKMKANEKTMEKIVALCKGRGFVYSGSEIYGGLANTWDYGPLGSRLKNTVKDCWRKRFIQERKNAFEVDADILMHPRVWEASGHVDSFADPLTDCRHCKTRHRADNLVNDYTKSSIGDTFNNEELIKDLKRNLVVPTYYFKHIGKIYYNFEEDVNIDLTSLLSEFNKLDIENLTLKESDNFNVVVYDGLE